MSVKVAYLQESFETERSYAGTQRPKTGHNASEGYPKGLKMLARELLN